MREIQGGSVNNRFIRCALSRRRKNFFGPLKREFASLFLPSQRRRFNYCSASWKSSVCFLSCWLRKARFYSSVSPPRSSSPVYPASSSSSFSSSSRGGHVRPRVENTGPSASGPGDRSASNYIFMGDLDRFHCSTLVFL